MSRTASVVVGVVLILLGALWTLQGLDIVGGSGMSGHLVWAVIGVILVALGLVVIARGARSGPARDS